MLPSRKSHRAALHPRTLLNIRNASRSDAGVYSCHVKNAFGRGNSSNAVYIDVFYTPLVTVWINPAVVAMDDGPVLLRCEAESGNPRHLTKVRWFREAVLVNETKESDVLLEKLERTTAGNYTCQAKNDAGWSPVSTSKELLIMYPPGPASIIPGDPSPPLKGQRVELTCHVNDSGLPATNNFRWEHGLNLLNVTGHTLVTEPVSTTTQGNYSCAAVNKVGAGLAAHWVLDALAPPSFVRPLPVTGGSLRNASAVSLECVVECDPLCEVSWLRNNDSLADSPFFQVSNAVRPEGGGHFHSVASVLSWNMSHLPPSSFDFNTFTCQSTGNEIGPPVSSSMLFRVESPPSFVRPLPVTGGSLRNASAVSLECVVECDPLCEVSWLRNNDSLADSPFFQVSNAVRPEGGGHFHSVASVLSWNMSHLPPSSFDFNTFTCQSTGNEIGPPVSSSMLFRVEYPPEKLHVSVVQLDMSEGEVPREVTCTASAHPTADYQWRLGALTVSRGPTLYFNSTASRDMAGNYTCVVSNRHGRAMAATLVTVRHPPEKLHVSVVQLDMSEGEVPREVTCTASAHPTADYQWRLGALTVSRGPTLYFNSTASRDMAGNYTCVVSNRHGRAMAATLVTVRHRPHCVIVKEHDASGHIVLTCEAQAVPAVSQFAWLRNNRTVQEDHGPRSTLVLPDRNPDSFGAYSCVASNAVGHSEPCQLKLSRLPSPAGWAQLLLKEENLIIMAGIAGGVVIIVVLLIVIVSIVVIRKRIHSSTKPRLEEREKLRQRRWAPVSDASCPAWNAGARMKPSHQEIHAETIHHTTIK
ncbi:hemicentin-1 [Ixodes scapularis]